MVRVLVNVAHNVPIPCPKCASVTSAVLYRHFDVAALMCPECEHIWEMNADAHPALLTIPLFNEASSVLRVVAVASLFVLRIYPQVCADPFVKHRVRAHEFLELPVWSRRFLRG
jgi:hypothetical protein